MKSTETMIKSTQTFGKAILTHRKGLQGHGIKIKTGS